MQMNQQYAAGSKGTVITPPPGAGNLEFLDRHSLRADRRPHAVVIGAGLGGLSSAIHLLRDGWRVTVLEKNARCGGRMNCI